MSSCFECFIDHVCWQKRTLYNYRIEQSFDNIMLTFSAKKRYRHSELSWRGTITQLLPKCWGKFWGRAQPGHPEDRASFCDLHKETGVPFSVPHTACRSCSCTHPEGLKNILIFSTLWDFILLQNMLTVGTWPLQLTKSENIKVI